MKRLRYQDLKANSQTISAHTGLSKEEFEALTKEFTKAIETYLHYYTLEGLVRQRAYKSRTNSVLPTTADKLLFILMFLKTNPLQEVHATSFGMNQPQASKWLKLLSKLLVETLAKVRVLPERKSERIAKAVAGLPHILIDVTEREVERSVDYETQKAYYSGKKSVILSRTC
jgi:hypothetical protein